MAQLGVIVYDAVMENTAATITHNAAAGEVLNLVNFWFATPTGDAYADWRTASEYAASLSTGENQILAVVETLLYDSTNVVIGSHIDRTNEAAIKAIIARVA